MQQPSLEEIFGSYMAWKLDDTTWCINFMNGTQNLYLLEGEEKVSSDDKGKLNSIEYTINNMVWEKIDDSLKKILESITLEDIIERHTSSGETMFYI